MNKSHIKNKMYSGEVCLGTWLFLPSPEVVEIIGLAGLDFVVIDMEHSPITYENTSSMNQQEIQTLRKNRYTQICKLI